MTTTVMRTLRGSRTSTDAPGARGDRGVLGSRAERAVAEQRLRAPARAANVARNARGERDRHVRWRPARDALWTLLDATLAGGERVAVVGAGNGDDLPLGRLAGRVAEVALIDLDARAARGARRRRPRQVRRRVTTIEHDVTLGAADAIATAAGREKPAGGRPRSGAAIAARGEPANARVVPDPPAPLPGAPYDLVIGDLLYSQLLYPALLDLGVEAPRRRCVLDRHGPSLTRAVVSRLHASAPDGRVLHLHDPLGWWEGHDQPVALERILAVAQHNPAAALRLVERGHGPWEGDPRRALAAAPAIPVGATALWRWPFAPGVDYLVCATLSP